MLQFFTTEPFACDPASLPQYPPTKEMDAKRRDDEARRWKFLSQLCILGAIIILWKFLLLIDLYLVVG